jgi:hypothetical protein
MPDFFWEQRRVRPSQPGDLNRSVEATGMVEKELEQFELSIGEHRLSPLMLYEASHLKGRRPGGKRVRCNDRQGSRRREG